MTLTGISGLGDEGPAPTRPLLLGLVLPPPLLPLPPPPPLLALLPGLAAAAEVAGSAAPAAASLPASSSPSPTTNPPRIQASSVRAEVVTVIGTVGILASTLTVYVDRPVRRRGH